MASQSARDGSNVLAACQKVRFLRVQIKRCFGTLAGHLRLLTGDQPVILQSTITEAPSRLERSGSFLSIGGADSLRTAQEITQSAVRLN